MRKVNEGKITIMRVMCWVKNGYRKKSRAYFYSKGIKKEFKYSIRYALLDDGKLTIKKNDIISVETVEADTVNVY